MPDPEALQRVDRDRPPREQRRHQAGGAAELQHAVAGTKRGAHLALSLERLDALLPKPVQRIGLSATQRPLSAIAAFLGGTGREVHIADAGAGKTLELEVIVPVEAGAGRAN